jgi:hypothetical protein
MFRKTNIRQGAKFGEGFLQEALQFVLTNSRNQGVSDFLNDLRGYIEGSATSATGIPSLKQGIKLLLVELWHKQIILLPTIFSAGSHFNSVPIVNELYSFIRSFEPKDQGQQQTARGVSGNARRLFFYMPRILWATNWRTIEDVSINELADLQRSQLLYLNGKSTVPTISSEAVPWSLFLTELHQQFPTRVGYSIDNLKQYSQWLNSRKATEYPFSEFTPASKKQRARQHRVSKVNLQNVQDFEQLVSQNSHEAALEYFSKLVGKPRRGFDWLESAPTYPGREHVDNTINSRLWRDAFISFVHYRKTVKGYESDKSVTTSLNVLADYIFLYIPWWKELFSDSDIEIPIAPKHFGRFNFVHRSSPERIEKYPATIIEVIKLRRFSADSQYQVIKYLQLFFKYVEQNYADDERMAGANFRSPIYPEFDLPRVKKRAKTSKIVFPKNSYGYLIYYGYAVEAFGEYLQARCMENGFSQIELGELSKSRWLATEKYGFIPIVSYRGKLTPLMNIPNMFVMESRLMRRDDLPSEERLTPHLTILRLLLSAIEVGLRLMGLRWLDRRTWDLGNVGAPNISQFSYYPTDKYVYELNVSTDKTKDAAWVTSVVFRVRSMMLREQKFQLSIDESNIDEEVPYANREHSRFGKIVPLFRSAKCASPIIEATYQRYWVSFLSGFQSFYRQMNGAGTLYVKVVPRGGEVKIKIDLESGAEYCPVSIVAINTPHACRATFATNRQGILETSDIADLLGHESVEVTAYYQSPRTEDLNYKLEVSDRELFESYQAFDKDDARYVRPDRQDSALVKSFRANRDETIRSFGFMPIVSLWSAEESERLDDDGITILREGPMSLIRFRDTHICPVGEECPSDIVQLIGGFRRCGLCSLAVKCIDHLPGIAAKKHILLERIQYLTKQRESLEAAGENSSAEDIWEEIDLDTNELMGWQLSEEILARIYQEKIQSSNTNNDELIYHVERPDIVRRHLQRVVRKTDQAEFLLQRIAEANAYPSMQTPQIQAVAANIRRKLRAGKSIPDLMSDIPKHDDVNVAASLLKTVMIASNLSVKELGGILTDNQIRLPKANTFQIKGNENDV